MKKFLSTIVKVVVIGFLLLVLIGSCADSDDTVTNMETEELSQGEKTVSQEETASGEADAEEASEDENADADQQDVATEQSDNDEDANADDNAGADSSDKVEEDGKYKVGDTTKFFMENGGEIAVTVTDWGTDYDSFTEEPLTYAEYYIENIGDEEVTVGNGSFNMYADDFSVDLTYSGSSDMYVGSANISSGRKVTGRVYGVLDPDSADNIELEVYDKIYVLKNKCYKTINANDMSVENIKISKDVKADSKQIANIAGHYYGYLSGKNGTSDINLSMYSSPEDKAVGNIELYLSSEVENYGDNSYKSEIVKVKPNIYALAIEGQEVLISFYTDNELGGEYGICANIYIDGEYVDTVHMAEMYRS